MRHHKKRSGQRSQYQSAVADAETRIAALTRRTSGYASETEMNRSLDLLFTEIVALLHLPARTGVDLEGKLTVLCRRLREFLDPADRGGTLTYLLAEAIRDDLRILMAAARDPRREETAEPTTPFPPR